RDELRAAGVCMKGRGLPRPLFLVQVLWGSESPALRVEFLALTLPHRRTPCRRYSVVPRLGRPQTGQLAAPDYTRAPAELPASDMVEEEPREDKRPWQHPI